MGYVAQAMYKYSESVSKRQVFKSAKVAQEGFSSETLDSTHTPSEKVW